MHLSATPYRAGFPIDSIAVESRLDPDSPAMRARRGGIGWLVNCTRPDLTPIHTFLASYSNMPSQGHLNAAKYVLHYIHSTVDHGISFSSGVSGDMHVNIHFPDSSDLEAYTDARPPVAGQMPTIYSDACWGGQYSNVVPDGTPLELFKYRSLSGLIVFRCGGPVSWKAIRQDQTALSSCEAEIMATNEAAKRAVDLRNLAEGMLDIGYVLSDLDEATVVYNDNEGCVNWAHNMTSKQIRHMSLRDNRVREWVQEDQSLDVVHIAGKLNLADIFTKEMKDGAQFRRLRDAFMSSHSKFIDDALESLRRSYSSADNVQLAAFAASSADPYTASDFLGDYLSVLTKLPVLQSLTSVSHLSSSGRSLLSYEKQWVPGIGGFDILSAVT